MVTAFYAAHDNSYRLVTMCAPLKHRLVLSACGCHIQHLLTSWLSDSLCSVMQSFHVRNFVMVFCAVQHR